MKKLRFAIIGAGNGGQSFAGHLGLLGFHVSLWDVDPQRVADLRKTNRMVVSGAVNGECDIPLVTGNIGEAVEGADVIMVVIPTVFQRSTIKSMVPYLKDGQALVLNPGATGGALEARAVLVEEGCKADVLVAETDTLLYACRSPKPGEAIIGGVKEGLSVAALPAKDTPRVAELLNQAFPQFKAVSSVLITSLNNANAMMHPAPTILNAGRIECKDAFDYYFQGVTPALARVVETLDAERLAIGKALGVEVPSIHDFYRTSYAAFGNNLHEQLQNVKAYEGIKGPTSLNTRYIFEDLPTGLVPLSALGLAMGVPTPTMNSLVELGNILLDRNFWVEGRSLEKLGLAGLSPEEVRAKVRDGN
jgi:opine dehydrogenase